MKKFKERNFKGKLLMILLLVSLITTTGTFAYWASGWSTINKPTQQEVVRVGTGETVATTVSLSTAEQDNLVLVPSGRVTDSSTQTDSLPITVPVTWTEDGTDTYGSGAVGNLTYEISNLKIGTESYANDNAKVVISVTNPGTINLDNLTPTDVIFTITLVEPSDVAAYELVAGLDITFDVTFTVSPQ